MEPIKTINLLDSNGGNRLDTIKGSTSSFFTGVDDMINQNFDPYVNGYAFIYWVKLPSWFEKDPDLKFFREMTQKNFMSFNGVDTINLGTASQTTGFAGHQYEVAAGVERGNTEFTIGHKEYSGGIMRKLYSKWMFMIRDPRTGVALYPKLFNVEYGARNHTAQLLYIVCRPDATNNNSKESTVEYAAFYSNVMPKNIPLESLYNYQLGSQESPTIEISFSAFPEIGPAVEKYAQKILKEKILAVSENGEGIPFIDTFGIHEDAAALTTGTLGDLFNTSNDSKR